MPTWNPTTQQYDYAGAPTDSAGAITDRSTLVSRRNAGRIVLGSEIDLPRTSSNIVTAIGDSITATAIPGARSTSWFQWAVRLANGAFRDGHTFATSGYTVQQILSTHVPQVIALSPRPRYCFCLMGANNQNDVTAAWPVMVSIYTALRESGITPILATCTPNGTQYTNVPKMNQLITRYALDNGLPLVDMYAATVDAATGQYKSGYSSDLTHPLIPGAKVMGEAAAAVLNKLAPNPPLTPPIAWTNNDPTNLFSAPLFSSGFVDANADGLPDGISGGRRGLSFALGQADAAITYVADAEIAGRWLTVERTGSSAAYLSITMQNGGDATVAPNDLIAFGCRVRVDAAPSGSDISVYAGPVNPAPSMLWPYTSALNAWKDSTIGAFTFYNEARMGAGADDVGLRIVLSGATGIKVSVGQVLIRNLTALGIT